tara:strand:+ start:205 stop:729 length:525 start_codon:yes stop_codon:yes gene_type:complete
MKDTENREEWYREGEEREKDFLKLYGDKLGLILNPCKNLDKTALDFFNKQEKMLSDLKDQSTPFFMAGKKYGIDPKFAVTFNKKDKDRYIEKTQALDIYIYFWTRWKEEERFGVNIPETDKVHRINFNKLLNYLTEDKLHEYQRRKNDKRPNAKSSYVVDVRNMELLIENGHLK